MFHAQGKERHFASILLQAGLQNPRVFLFIKTEIDQPLGEIIFIGEDNIFTSLMVPQLETEIDLTRPENVSIENSAK